MPLGIKPTVDFAFKKIFGSPQNSASLIGLLNAILDLESPIVAVDILNPFSNGHSCCGVLRTMYDQREKAQRDYEWALSGAREEGREEGEQAGLTKGILAGKIQLLEELLGGTPTTDADLQACAIEALNDRLADLQVRLRDRKA